jgi:hypothetical protein
VKLFAGSAAPNYAGGRIARPNRRGPEEDATVNRLHLAGVTLLTCLALLAAGTAFGGPDDEGISFKQRGNEEKRFAARVGEAVVKAAHATARKPTLVKHEYTTPKPNRTELKLKMEYQGAVTNKRYVADITVIIDSTAKDAWEVVNVEYADNNNVPANLKKVQGLIKEMNK